MGPGYFWNNWGLFPMMPAFMVIFFLIMLYLIFIRGGRPFCRGDFESAIEILKKRYAKGEITREEFEQMKKDMEK